MAKTKNNTDLIEFTKKILNKLTRFYFTPASGLETIEGVPLLVFTDPDGRCVVELFSSDGERAYLYLEHVTTFIVFQKPIQSEEAQEVKISNKIDMNAVDTAQLQGQVVGEYYSPSVVKEE
jgi:hypothetical protein